MVETVRKTEKLPVNEAFAVLADAAAVDRAAQALCDHGFDARVVDSGAEAREMVLSLIPEGAEVGTGASLTLDQIGVTEALQSSGRYDLLGPKVRSMDRATQMREIRKLGAAPDFQLNSVHAVTEDGRMVTASATGSQLTPMAFGAGRLILVAGAQKVVPDLATAFRRVEEYSYPMEDARAQAAYNGMRSSVRKLLVLNGDLPGRTTVVLVREPLGV
jgi:hypothetical protein